MDRAPSSFVTVASRPTIVEAEAVRAALEGSGIRSTLVDGNLVTAQPFWGIALGQVGIQVRGEDAAQAAEVVRALEAADLAARNEADGASENACISCGAEFPEYLDRCPACGLSYG